MAIKDNTGEWEECIVDSDYEIFNQYPYSIRRKGSDKIINGWFDKSTGYINCKLNNQKYKYHRVIATQWISNPNNLPEVDHINGDRTDNRINNLRWTSRSDNMRNRSSSHGYQYTFLDELPENVERLDAYNGHEFDGLYIDYDNEKLYLFNGVRYRELVPCRNRGNICYYINDIENINRSLYHKVLFG